MAGKILIADDSLKIQQQLTEMLKSADIEIVAVSNGEYAVRKLPEAKPDLVLADIFMPVRTGYEVCEFIKTNEEYAQIPVLLLASTLEPYDEEEAARVQSDGKIDKPFADPQATLATIKEHLDRALSGKPSEPVVGADEFAAAVPAAEGEEEQAAEPAPEPEAEAAPAVGEETLVMTPEPAPELQPSDEPMGFADMMEQESAEPAPAAPEPVAAEKDIPFAAAALEESPAETAAEPEAAAPAEAPPTPELEEEPAPREVEKAELAAPWEMTQPPEGAPEIPTGGDWEGQDREQPAGVEEEKPGAAPEETAAPEESAAVEKTEAPTEEAPTEPATASEADTAQPFPPEEFAAAFGSETEEAPADSATKPEPAAEPEPATAATTAPSEAGPGSIDKMVEEIAKKVVEQLSPEVMESLAKELAKEIAKPLAEKIVKKKLIE